MNLVNVVGTCVAVAGFMVITAIVFKESPKRRRRPTISIDFDGVLHAYTSGWRGASVILDGPVPGAIEWLVELVEHFDVVVCSARASRPWGWWAIRRWLRQQIMAHFGCAPVIGDDVASGIRVTSRKPAAIVYVDDRAWRFDGKHFPNSIELRMHRPWCAVKKGAPQP